MGAGGGAPRNWRLRRAKPEPRLLGKLSTWAPIEMHGGLGDGKVNEDYMGYFYSTLDLIYLMRGTMVPNRPIEPVE